MSFTGWCVILIALLIGAGTALVITEHYAWAWIPFLFCCFVGGGSSCKCDKHSGDQQK